MLSGSFSWSIENSVPSIVQVPHLQQISRSSGGISLDEEDLLLELEEELLLEEDEEELLLELEEELLLEEDEEELLLELEEELLLEEDEEELLLELEEKLLLEEDEEELLLELEEELLLDVGGVPFAVTMMLYTQTEAFAPGLSMWIFP